MVVLTNAEIIEVTGRRRNRAQAAVLALMRIPFVVRPDGRPIVTRLAFERVVGHDSRRRPTAEPKFESLDS